jgi:protein N-terminal methyltransferase
VIGHLNDTDFILFFQRCCRALKPHGLIVVKDNVILDPSITYCMDLDDSSVSRNVLYSKLLYRLADLKIVSEKQQRDFPEELYPVVMIALAHKDNSIFFS